MSDTYDEPTDEFAASAADEPLDGRGDASDVADAADVETAADVATTDAADEAEPDADPDADADADASDDAAVDAETSDDTAASEVSDDAAVNEDGSDDAAADSEAAEAAPVDPLEEFRATLRAKPGDWYVVHTYSGMENRVKTNLENRTTSLNMEDYIHEIVRAPPRRSPRSRTASARWSRGPCFPATCWSGWT